MREIQGQINICMCVRNVQNRIWYLGLLRDDWNITITYLDKQSLMYAYPNTWMMKFSDEWFYYIKMCIYNFIWYARNIYVTKKKTNYDITVIFFIKKKLRRSTRHNTSVKFREKTYRLISLCLGIYTKYKNIYR